MVSVIFPLKNLKLTCPKCKGETRFKRASETEEGQYCSTCHQFIENIIEGTYPEFIKCEETEISKLKDWLQRGVDKRYAEVANPSEHHLDHITLHIENNQCRYCNKEAR
ncbi:MAG: hypothetical protein HYY22_07820 [Thaumarchaeota archaeon]|nr:hypothetical protein [Nitrososphaerota archaeon]